MGKAIWKKNNVHDKQLPIQGWSICVDERDVDLDYKIQNEEKFGDRLSKETVCKIAKGLIKD